MSLENVQISTFKEKVKSLLIVFHHDLQRGALEGPHTVQLYMYLSVLGHFRTKRLHKQVQVQGP